MTLKPNKICHTFSFFFKFQQVFSWRYFAKSLLILRCQNVALEFEHFSHKLNLIDKTVINMLSVQSYAVRPRPSLYSPFSFSVLSLKLKIKLKEFIPYISAEGIGILQKTWLMKNLTWIVSKELIVAKLRLVINFWNKEKN